MSKNSEDIALIKLLSQGADERIFTNEKGLTKYGVEIVNTKTVNRGSCTSSVVTGDNFERIKGMYHSIKSDREWIAENDQIFDKIKKVINKKEQDNFELVLAPSGTDLVYIPIIIAKLIHPNKKILNITTCIEELGSGTRLAAEGKFYADYNQFGEKVKKGTKSRLDTLKERRRANVTCLR